MISIEKKIGKFLTKNGLKLAIAESCTGGLISHRITNIAGSSAFFEGTVVAYSYEAKVDILGLDWESLQKHGAVSADSVEKMAEGSRKLYAADIGLSISGIAGPAGATDDKPVGTIWIGISNGEQVQSELFFHEGDRLENKEAGADKALHILYDFLIKHYRNSVE